MATKSRCTLPGGAKFIAGSDTLVGGTVDVESGLTIVESAVGFLGADPAPATEAFYATASGGTVTFTCGNLASDFYYQITGR